MTALQRLQRTRRVLLSLAVGEALLWAVAVVSAELALLAVADLAWPMSVDARRLLFAGIVIEALVVAGVILWRARHARALDRVALWVEERVPQLRYGLVTAAELGGEADFTPEPPVRDEWSRGVRSASRRALLLPLGVTLAATLLLLVLPRAAVGRATRPRAGDSIARAGTPANRLSPLVARIAPPRYTGLPDEAIDDPATIRAVAGSSVRLVGRGDADGITLAPAGGGRPFAALAAADSWSIAMRMPVQAVALRLADARSGRARTLVLEPRVDEAPVVTLASPARDSVLRAPRGRITLRAEAHDDFGIARAVFELIVSSGEGESFTFQGRTLGELRPGGARSASLAATLDLASLALKPGDVLHIRAVARDLNDATGPGNGASETRTLRIARPGEYDSVAVDAAPPAEAEKSALSQRMLIKLTEALEKRRRTLSREVLLTESSRISADQKRLRKAVSELVFMRLGGAPSGEESGGEADRRAGMTPAELLAAAEEATASASGGVTDFEGDETPVVATNRPLLEAYNAMWSASGELDQGATNRALPHMYAALAALQRARAAERIYLRGRPPAVIVDLAKVRLSGDRPPTVGQAAERGERDPLIAIAARFDRALDRLAARDPAAPDSLALLRVETLTLTPPFARELGDALDRMRQRQDALATAALARARAALTQGASRAPAVLRWGGGW